MYKEKSSSFNFFIISLKVLLLLKSFVLHHHCRPNIILFIFHFLKKDDCKFRTQSQPPHWNKCDRLSDVTDLIKPCKNNVRIWTYIGLNPS